MAFQVVTTLDALWSGEMIAFPMQGKRVLLVNIGGEIRAYEDACPHMRTPLSEGALEGATLTCATHGWVFDVSTGRGINPAQTCLTEFAVVIKDNEILVDVEQSSTPRSTSVSGRRST
jgi:toluene monooxygenase system ferredoxin subunit